MGTIPPSGDSFSSSGPEPEKEPNPPSLPPEIWDRAFRFLDRKELQEVVQTSSLWRDLGINAARAEQADEIKRTCSLWVKTLHDDLKIQRKSLTKEQLAIVEDVIAFLESKAIGKPLPVLESQNLLAMKENLEQVANELIDHLQKLPILEMLNIIARSYTMNLPWYLAYIPFVLNQYADMQEGYNTFKKIDLEFFDLETSGIIRLAEALYQLLEIGYFERGIQYLEKVTQDQNIERSNFAFDSSLGTMCAVYMSHHNGFMVERLALLIRDDQNKSIQLSSVYKMYCEDRNEEPGYDYVLEKVRQIPDLQYKNEALRYVAEWAFVNRNAEAGLALVNETVDTPQQCLMELYTIAERLLRTNQPQAAAIIANTIADMKMDLSFEERSAVVTKLVNTALNIKNYTAARELADQIVDPAHQKSIRLLIDRMEETESR